MKPEEDIKYDSDFIIDIIPNYVQGRRRGYTGEGTSLIANEVFEEMQKALEKQIPKKPERLNAFKAIEKCGGCEGVISTRTASVYCQYCGNKVDWGNDDE